MNGIFPAAAMPLAIVAMPCSATPTSMNRSGNSFSNHSARVDSERSPQSTTTLSSFFPASTTPWPNPSRVALFSRSGENGSATSFARASIMSGVFVRHLAAHSADFLEEFPCLRLGGRLAVPGVVALDVRDAFPGDRVRDDHRRLLENGFRLADRVHECRDVVAVHFEHMPVER